ncbi:MAG: hypothetical protein U5L09_16925 [Bacteroidales bacterium]|nr:hypothetical protein [Bacteroidales bacterium]
MAIIGEIIKKVVELADSTSGDSNPVEAQKEVLEELLSKAEEHSLWKVL